MCRLRSAIDQVKCVNYTLIEMQHSELTMLVIVTRFSKGTAKETLKDLIGARFTIGVTMLGRETNNLQKSMSFTIPINVENIIRPTKQNKKIKMPRGGLKKETKFKRIIAASI